MDWDAWLGWLVLTAAVVTVIVVLDITSRKHAALQRESKANGISEKTFSAPKHRRDGGRSDEVLNELRRRRDELAEPSLVLNLATSSGFSKFGGDPDLPVGVSWPSDSEASRAFVLQVDLAEMPSGQRPGWLPASGRIYVFSEWEALDAPDCVRVIYAPSSEGSRTPPPNDRTRRFPERPIAFEAVTSTPTLEWRGVDSRTLDVIEDDLFLFFEEEGGPWPGEPGSKVGGFPDEIQGDMRLDCEMLSRGLAAATADQVIPEDIEQASHDWRLLVQIASNDKLKMNWGDSGLLYVYVRREDAKRGDFSRTVTIWQTY